jgi:hypothetical protein
MTETKLRKGMKAFTASKTGKFFHVRSTLISPFYPGHAESFKLAADMVLDSHEAATGPHNDKLLYPTIYLYRHSLELKLKDLILLGVKCGNFNLTEVEDVLGKHELSNLWARAKRFLLAHYPNVKSQVSVVEAVVQEFRQIDKDGQTLRYDRDKGLRQRKYEHVPTHIGVSNLRVTMGKVFSFLEMRYDGVLNWWDAGSE